MPTWYEEFGKAYNADNSNYTDQSQSPTRNSCCMRLGSRQSSHEQEGESDLEPRES